MSRMVFEMANLIDFTPNDVTYQTLISSGDMKIFKSFDLRAQIEKHYGGYKTILKDYRRQESINEKYIGPFFIDEIDFERLAAENYKFLDHPRFKRILQSLYGTFTLQIAATKRGIQSCDELLSKLIKA
jgi:hypothetical protein